VPAIPVKAEVGLFGVVTVPPAPVMMVQVPDPTTGVFPAKVAEVPQIVWSVPALDTVGVWLTVTVTEAQVVVLQAPE
jgi:hypothetical protein